MPQTTCVVPECSNTGDFKIPKNETVKKAWIHAIRRGKTKYTTWEPTSKYCYICADHFTEDDFFKLSYHGHDRVRRTLKKSAVPSNFKWTTTIPEHAARKERLLARKRRIITQDENLQNTDVDSDSTIVFDDQFQLGASELVDFSQIKTSVQEEIATEPKESNGNVPTYSSTMTQTVKQPLFSIENFRSDNAGIHFYTGLENIVKFFFVLNTLGPAAYSLNYAYHNVCALSVPDQFFLVLMKLRRNTTHFELSRLFSISEASVANVVLTWIFFMYKQWKEIQIWTPQELVRYFAPSGFKSSYPSTRVIIDGTECPIKKPSNPKSQQATFSTYKNRNTVKVLVGASPGGLISYLSPSYGGSTSDRQIVERSTLTNLCDPKDSIMADKGFNVHDIFAPMDVTINIPTFFKKKNRMSQNTAMRDRKVSSKRVHIERLIGLAKTYKILVHPMTATETKLSEEIIFICCMLCNFRSNIVPKHA